MSVRTERELEPFQRIEIKYYKIQIQKISIAIVSHNNKHEL